jgi:Phage integrase family
MYERRGKFYFDRPLTEAEKGLPENAGKKGIWVGLGEDYSEAMAQYGRLAGPNRTCRALSDVFRRYLSEITPLPLKGRPRTQEAIDNEIRTISRFERVFGHMAQDALTQKHLYQYIDTRIDEREEFRELKKPAPSAARHDVRFLKKMLAKGIKWGAGTVNAVIGLEFDPDPPDARDVTPEELAAISSVASERMQIAIELADLTGQDAQEIRLIRPKTDFTEEGILFRRGKTGNSVLVEWTPALRAVVDRALALKPDIPKDYLLRNEEGKPYTKDGFKSMWQKLMRKATSPGPDGEPPLVAKRFKFKHLRKKTATDVAELQGEQAAADMLAHSDPKVTRKNYIQPRGRKPTRAKPVR